MLPVSTVRQWTRPNPDSMASARIAVGFNIEVEGDILFVKVAVMDEDLEVLHLVNRGIRCQLGDVLADRSTKSVLEVIDNWVGLFGP